MSAAPPDVLDTLVRLHGRELHVHCHRLLGSPEDAEDAVQETFVRAWARRDTFAGRSTVRAWLHGIAVNTWLDALRKRKSPEDQDGALAGWEVLERLYRGAGGSRAGCRFGIGVLDTTATHITRISMFVDDPRLFALSGGS